MTKCKNCQCSWCMFCFLCRRRCIRLVSSSALWRHHQWDRRLLDGSLCPAGSRTVWHTRLAGVHRSVPAASESRHTASDAVRAADIHGCAVSYPRVPLWHRHCGSSHCRGCEPRTLTGSDLTPVSWEHTDRALRTSTGRVSPYHSASVMILNITRVSIQHSRCAGLRPVSVV